MRTLKVNKMNTSFTFLMPGTQILIAFQIIQDIPQFGICFPRFKDIEKNGGLITQLMEGTIQRKINESAQKEQELFDSGKEVLLGTNKYPNKNDKMANDLELFPFVKTNPRKTLVTPIIERRLAEKLEQERLKHESDV